MGVFDQAARYAAQADPEAVLHRLLLARGVSWRFREWLDTRTLPLPGGPESPSVTLLRGTIFVVSPTSGLARNRIVSEYPRYANNSPG